MATKQTEIKGAATLGDGAPINNDHVTVWSSMRYPLTLTKPVSRFAGKKEGGAMHLTAKFKINPGPNRVPRDIWEHSAKREMIQRRIDERDLVVSAVAPGDHKAAYRQIEEGHAPQKGEMIAKLQPLAEKTSMSAALKATGAPRGIADLDDAHGAITLGD